MKAICYIVGALLGIWLFSLCVSCKKADTAPAPVHQSSSDTDMVWAQFVNNQAQINAPHVQNVSTQKITIYAQNLPHKGPWSVLPVHNIYYTGDSMYIHYNGSNIFVIYSSDTLKSWYQEFKVAVFNP
jgi:hypothetical protein